jgi:hypothetical protein
VSLILGYYECKYAQYLRGYNGPKFRVRIVDPCLLKHAAMPEGADEHWADLKDQSNRFPQYSVMDDNGISTGLLLE